MCRSKRGYVSVWCPCMTLMCSFNWHTYRHTCIQADTYTQSLMHVTCIKYTCFMLLWRHETRLRWPRGVSRRGRYVSGCHTAGNAPRRGEKSRLYAALHPWHSTQCYKQCAHFTTLQVEKTALSLFMVKYGLEEWESSSKLPLHSAHLNSSKQPMWYFIRWEFQ